MAAAAGGAGAPAGRLRGRWLRNTSPVNVGYMVPLTGNFASNGRNEINGFNLGLKDFGDTVNGRKITPIVVDTQADPNIALSQAHQLVENQNIDILQGPLRPTRSPPSPATWAPRAFRPTTSRSARPSSSSTT